MTSVNVIGFYCYAFVCVLPCLCGENGTFEEKRSPSFKLQIGNAVTHDKRNISYESFKDSTSKSQEKEIPENFESAEKPISETNDNYQNFRQHSVVSPDSQEDNDEESTIYDGYYLSPPHREEYSPYEEFDLSPPRKWPSDGQPSYWTSHSKLPVNTGPPSLHRPPILDESYHHHGKPSYAESSLQVDSTSKPPSFEESSFLVEPFSLDENRPLDKPPTHGESSHHDRPAPHSKPPFHGDISHHNRPPFHGGLSYHNRPSSHGKPSSQGGSSNHDKPPFPGKPPHHGGFSHHDRPPFPDKPPFHGGSSHNDRPHSSSKPPPHSGSSYYNRPPLPSKPPSHGGSSHHDRPHSSSKPPPHSGSSNDDRPPFPGKPPSHDGSSHYYKPPHHSKPPSHGKPPSHVGSSHHYKPPHHSKPTSHGKPPTHGNPSHGKPPSHLHHDRPPAHGKPPSQSGTSPIDEPSLDILPLQTPFTHGRPPFNIIHALDAPSQEYLSQQTSNSDQGFYSDHHQSNPIQTPINHVDGDATASLSEMNNNYYSTNPVAVVNDTNNLSQNAQTTLPQPLLQAQPVRPANEILHGQNYYYKHLIDIK